MKEILDGVFHWTREHPKIKVEVSSYALADERVLLHPLIPEGGLDAIPIRPKYVLLTNRHHYRDSQAIAEHFGAEVQCVEQGLHEFDASQKVRGFHFGELLGCGIEVLEVGAISPDDTALFVPRHGGILAAGDGVIRMGEPLSFVPDEYMGDNADAVKTGLRAALKRLTDEREFDHLLLAHGAPWIGGARDALRRFADA